ncbi:MAG: sensor histidine kinase [Actinobacteria bacterium]|nr:MAG: sensor histidine kinase [Actinomycetota bacterium]
MSDPDRLIDLVSAVTGDEFLKVEENLGDGYVRLRVSEAERRQAKHDIRGIEDVVVELLRNARDAHAQRVFVATAREGDSRTLTIVDDGVGVPPAMQERVFEPRVTSKLETMVMDRWGVHGRGMALFSVRSNAVSARIEASDAHKGTAVRVVADTGTIGERADQSQWPEVETGDDGSLRVVRGPHNILRRVVEFACEHPEVDVWIGSPSEIVATMHEVVRASADASELLFCDDPSRLPVWQRPGAAADAAELTATAESLGLPISERTAHRVLAGDITVVPRVLDVLRPSAPTPEPVTPDIYRDRRGLKIAKADLVEFTRALTAAFDAISERYYVHLRGEPRVTVGRDEIRVRFDVDKDD